MITLWNEDCFSVKACINNQRCISVAGELVQTKNLVVFCNMYAANVEREHLDLWDFILQSQLLFPFSWCIRGDFNIVFNSSKRRGSFRNMGSIKNFNSFVLQARVIDLPIWGSPFIWSNNREEAFWARLDRFLISPQFLS